jgi:aldehyde:ferredoxin oxidoreductase
MTRGGYTGRILYVDLSARKADAKPTPDDLIRDFVGGRGFVAKILWDMVAPGTAPFSPRTW